MELNKISYSTATVYDQHPSTKAPLPTPAIQVRTFLNRSEEAGALLIFFFTRFVLIWIRFSIALIMLLNLRHLGSNTPVILCSEVERATLRRQPERKDNGGQRPRRPSILNKSKLP